MGAYDDWMLQCYAVATLPLVVRCIPVNCQIQRRRGGGLYMKELVFIMACIFVMSPVFADEKRLTVPINDSPVLGPADATVTIIEFLDFQ